MRKILDVEPDGTAIMRGVETGDLLVYDWTAGTKTIIVHEAGHHYWSSQTQPRAYAEAKWIIYRLTFAEENADGSLTLGVEWQADIPVSTNDGGRRNNADKTRADIAAWIGYQPWPGL